MPDVLIAASAIAYDVPLYSCNPSDFDVIPGLGLNRALPDSGSLANFLNFPRLVGGG